MTEPRARHCFHGSGNEILIETGNPMNDFEEIMKDLEIIEENTRKPVPSNKITKKAMARIEKRHRRYVKPDEKSSLLTWAYGFCAELILDNDLEEAFIFCGAAIDFQLRVWNETEATKKALLLSKGKIAPYDHRGLILHVAKRVPCGCLERARREAKKKPRTAHCCGCQQDKLFSEMLQCSGCRMFLYCSEECNKLNWKDHKVVCRATKKELSNQDG